MKKIPIHNKKQENKTHNQGKKSTETEPEMTKIIEIKDKDFNIVIINMPKTLKENMNVMRK